MANVVAGGRCLLVLFFSSKHASSRWGFDFHMNRELDLGVRVPSGSAGSRDP